MVDEAMTLLEAMQASTLGGGQTRALADGDVFYRVYTLRKGREWRVFEHRRDGTGYRSVHDWYCHSWADVCARLRACFTPADETVWWPVEMGTGVLP